MALTKVNRSTARMPLNSVWQYGCTSLKIVLWEVTQDEREPNSCNLCVVVPLSSLPFSVITHVTTIPRRVIESQKVFTKLAGYKKLNFTTMFNIQKNQYPLRCHNDIDKINKWHKAGEDGLVFLTPAEINSYKVTGYGIN